MDKQPYTHKPHWAWQAACAKPGAAYMFPHDSNKVGIKTAKEECRYCPVQPQCLEEALERGEEYGIWGGLDHRELRALRRKMARHTVRTDNKK